LHSDILNPEIQRFIDANVGKDISRLALQKNPFPEVEWIAILNQIASKSKAKDKLPTWFSTCNILYPVKISMEQASSEKTAQYKATLVSGNQLIDLTGGFGVDDYYFSKKMNAVIHCEIDPDLSSVVANNFEQLKASNIQCIAGDSIQQLTTSETDFDWIYIDPSRRNDAKGKVFMLRDCLPNVPELLDVYLKKAQNILIKTAPILDISAGLAELEHVANIHIVAVDNEVKELLWEIKKDHLGDIKIRTINLIKDHQERFEFIHQQDSFAAFSLPKRYLYEPNSAIMKSGGFDEVSRQFNLDKLHPHSHLYTSDNLVPFPGRIFEIQKNIPYQKTEMKAFLENKKANITARNFPDTVETIRKKWKINDGGDQYCFFTTDVNNNKIVLICSKIK